jgi:hypothetical protein
MIHVGFEIMLAKDKDWIMSIFTVIFPSCWGQADCIAPSQNSFKSLWVILKGKLKDSTQEEEEKCMMTQKIKECVFTLKFSLMLEVSLSIKLMMASLSCSSILVLRSCGMFWNLFLMALWLFLASIIDSISTSILM